MLLDRYGKGNWCIIADGDELLSYPHIEKLSIKDICSFLDMRKFTALRCLFIDMYSKKPINKTFYSKGNDLFSVCPFFDSKGYKKIYRKYVNDCKHSVFYVEDVIGGPRKRVLGAEKAYACKVPLFRYSNKITVFDGHHFIDGASISDIRGVVFHFKYLSNFSLLVEYNAKAGQYCDNSWEYRRYLERLKENRDMSLFYHDSVRFKNTAQMIKLGLMKTSDRFEKFARERLFVGDG